MKLERKRFLIFIFRTRVLVVMIKQTGTLNKYSDKQCCIYGLFGRFDNNYVKCGLLVWQESVCCAQREEESTAGDKHNPR
jgi:hypothetical protein